MSNYPRCCDWCGAYCHCERCDDPKTAALMDGPDIPGVFTNPMDEKQGGHIHACCDEHLVYWEDAVFATSIEGLSSKEICAMIPTLTDVRLKIASMAMLETALDEEDDCECVVDHEDGSTIRACDLHPQGGSLKGMALWAAGKAQ